VSHDVVDTILREEGYSLQANAKTKEGTENPDRDAQFRYINKQAIDHMELLPTLMPAAFLSLLMAEGARAEGLNEVWNGKPGFTPVTSEAPGAASGAPVAETAPVPEVERLSPDQEKVINHYATWTVTLETNRNNYVNMTGKLPDPLPINVTEAMMEGSGAYILRSHETDGYPGQRKALLDCLAGAQKDFVEAGSTVKPFNYYYASHLSQAGRDEKIFMPFAAVGDEYLRSYREGAPPQDPSKPIDIHQFE